MVDRVIKIERERNDCVPGGWFIEKVIPLDEAGCELIAKGNHHMTPMKVAIAFAKGMKVYIGMPWDTRRAFVDVK